MSSYPVMRSCIVAASILIAMAFGQASNPRCDANLKACAAAGIEVLSSAEGFSSTSTDLTDHDLSPGGVAAPSHTNPDPGTAVYQPADKHFHWGRALSESFTFLLIEQAYVIHTDFRWVVSQNGIPFNHYWRDYTESLSQWTHSGWNDGDPDWFGYIGHPIQGALTGFIQIQNDPKSERLEFSGTRAYWKSRLKSMLWNAAYSTQWNLGPLSEPTVEKYGAKDRAPWNQNGSFPCSSKHCYTGVGQIDIVMTPLAGTAWRVRGDFLDTKFVRHVGDTTQALRLVDTVRVALNPLRGGANILHGKHPWYRASRDDRGTLAFTNPNSTSPTGDIHPGPLRDHAATFFGYSHAGSSHCEVVPTGAGTNCDPLSGKSSNLGGWNISAETMYLRYFGAIAEFSGQYGGWRRMNFLFWL